MFKKNDKVITKTEPVLNMFQSMVFGMLPVSAINYVSNMFIRFWKNSRCTGAPGTQLCCAVLSCSVPFGSALSCSELI